MTVEFLSADDLRIVSFLKSHDHLLIHTPEYVRFVSVVFACPALFSCAVLEGEIKTVLPIVEVKSHLFGKRIISSAFLEYGGFVGDPAFVKEILDALSQRYASSFHYLEVRSDSNGFDKVLSLLMIKKDLYKRFVLKLGASSHTSGEIPQTPQTRDSIPMFSTFNTVHFSSGTISALQWFRSNIQEAKRKAIKKAKRENVMVKDVPEEDLDNLYSLYCLTMKRFGSPGYSRAYFVEFYRHFISKNMGKIYGAYIQDTLVAALVGFCYGDRVHIIISISDDKYREYRPNDAVHSEFIEWAIGNNFAYFDFGRVREESGQFEYKQKWGPTLLELPSYFLLWNGKDVSVVDPSNVKYRVFVVAWKKVPLWLTKRIGHRLRKELGI